MTDAPEDRPLGPRLVVASHNAGKIFEFRMLLAPYRIAVASAGELGIDEPEETAASFVGNARLKALNAARASGLPALADDSGMAAAALGGAPGIYTARWAGPGRDFAVGMEKVEAALQSVGALTPEARRAKFVAALCLAWPDGSTRDFVGIVEGTLVWPPRGDLGFGFDPMFQPDGHARTFGEMTGEEKHGLDHGPPLSHRARAFALFAAACLAAGATA